MSLYLAVSTSLSLPRCLYRAVSTALSLPRCFFSMPHPTTLSFHYNVAKGKLLQLNYEP